MRCGGHGFYLAATVMVTDLRLAKSSEPSGWEARGNSPMTGEPLPWLAIRGARPLSWPPFLPWNSISAQLEYNSRLPIALFLFHSEDYGKLRRRERMRLAYDRY